MKNVNRKVTKKAFTLIELLVGITITTILLLSASNLNFNRLNIKQELDIFINKVKGNYETIRNSSMAGKGVGIDLILPEKRKIEYSMYNSGTIINRSFDGTNWITHDLVPLFKKGFSISKIRCLQLDFTEVNDLATTETGAIQFTGSDITLTGSCTNTSKILELTIKNKYEEDILLINTLNGLSEIQ